MKLWEFHNPYDYDFAQAGELGAYVDDRLCPTCGAALQKRVPPLRMYWEPGSDLIGDFVWPHGSRDTVVGERVLAALKPFGGFRYTPIEFVENSERRLPKRPARVRLPYEGPTLWELWPTEIVAMDREASSVEFGPICPTCGTERLKVAGLPFWQVLWDQVTLTGSRVFVPREPGKGIYVRESDLDGTGIFTISDFQLPRLMMTDPVRELVLAQGFTNVEFLEMGETTPG